MQRQFTDDGFEFDRLILLGGAVRGLTDVGEVLSALDHVTDGDDESWIAAFTPLAERLLRHAQASARSHLALDAEILGKITCPVLITAPDHEQFWPAQSHQMHEALPGSTLMRFLDAEGASWHCEPAAHLLRDERVFDWLAEVFSTSA